MSVFDVTPARLIWYTGQGYATPVSLYKWNFAFLEDIIKLFNDYSNLSYSVQRAINEMFETYRGINGQIRSDKVRPEYWNDKYVMDEHYLKPDLKFPNCDGYFFAGNTIQAKMVDLQTQLNTKHNNFVEKLNEYKAKIDQWILELKKRYELS